MQFLKFLKARCYTTNLKSPLLHGNIFTKSYKAQMLFWHLFYKAQNDIVAPIFTKPKCYCGTYFCKARMIFWHLFLQSPNALLAPISQSPILFWHLYLQSSNIILAKTITLYSKAQNYFSAKIYLHILKPPIYGKYKLLISQKYFFYKIYGNYAYFFHNQLTTKAHVYYP